MLTRIRLWPGLGSKLQNQSLINSDWVPLTLELWDLSLQLLIESNTAWNHWNKQLSAVTSNLRSLCWCVCVCSRVCGHISSILQFDRLSGNVKRQVGKGSNEQDVCVYMCIHFMCVCKLENLIHYRVSLEAHERESSLPRLKFIPFLSVPVSLTNRSATRFQTLPQDSHTAHRSWVQALRLRGSILLDVYLSDACVRHQRERVLLWVKLEKTKVRR